MARSRASLRDAMLNSQGRRVALCVRESWEGGEGKDGGQRFSRELTHGTLGCVGSSDRRGNGGRDEPWLMYQGPGSPSTEMGATRGGTPRPLVSVSCMRGIKRDVRPALGG